MPVRNAQKAGQVKSQIRRKTFVGDVASLSTPEHNPEPSTARGRRRATQGKATPAPRPELLVGLGKRPHISGGKVPGSTKVGGVHTANETYTRLVSLVHGRRVYHN